MNNNYIKAAYFNLPGAFEKKELLPIILHYFDQNPYMIKNNAYIHSVYGSPFCVWNGGRIAIPNFYYSKSQLEEIRDYYNNQNIAIRFTFSNSELSEKHIFDDYGNLILKIFSNGKNEMICYSTLLEKYIRDNYKDKFKFILSTTKKENKEKTFERNKFNKYDFVCLNYDLNKDFTFLESLEEKDKIELLVNPVCPANCPRAKQHYKNVSLMQLAICEQNFSLLKKIQEENIQNKLNCDEKFLFEQKRFKNFISVKELNSFYLQKGFNMIKIEGRTAFDLNYIDTLIYYLVKNEYQDIAKKQIQIAYMENLYSHIK